jgi:hypothetical protein
MELPLRFLLNALRIENDKGRGGEIKKRRSQID